MKLLAALTAATLSATMISAAPAAASYRPPISPTATGYGGAVSSVDPTVTAVGLEVLRRGGNAVDAAIAAAATIGVTEPFSAGIGGGGFFVYYDARTRRVHTIDGREAAPASMRENSFQNPDGTALDFNAARVSGLSVGVPGTLAIWAAAADRWGSRSLGELLRPAADVADRGFTVDATFNAQVTANAAIFGQFGSSTELFLPGGTPPAVGSTFRNPDLADTYRLIAKRGPDVFYEGAIARDIAATVQAPPVSDTPIGTWTHPIRPGGMTVRDLARYQARFPAPTRSGYRGLDVYGMATPSSGGTAVGEALNILEGYDLGALDDADALHRYLEASALAFADRNRYVGDNTRRGVLDELLSDRFAAERRCVIGASALPKPVAPGTPDGSYTGCSPAGAGVADTDASRSTTHLTVADRWGNVVSFTFTIEQIGGAGIVVPGRGILLNNELTDFNFTPTQGTAADPNLPAPGKRPRSSMSPTIVLKDGKPFVAVGSPGGATIITTVLQILVNRIDLGMTLPEAVAAPRASQRNSATPQAEPAFIAAYGADLTALGHPAFTSTAEIGAATAIEFGPNGQLTAVAEPVRRGVGAAGVVRSGR
ncbi:gamma-glutamyltransferase [Catenuloplanes indicus JCM 9534]|uniref:Glutathione hydrolase proenzyme n=2 Tax=Catenuloplanes indicus TaxID=137267 RepID=A0AAE3W6M1_9ACTN|nr:gamma-glutamyltranspeptidase/glutathione hydrolase [Catenuloplanes indicus]